MNEPSHRLRLQVDFNNLVRGGQVLYRHRRADPELAVGDTVIAEDGVEGMEFTATVSAIDPDTGYVYLVMDWEPADPDIQT